MREEQCNARDDDCDGIIDEDADSFCAIAHAAAACVRGTCVIERCSIGYFNCNATISDGCETRVSCDQQDASTATAPDAAAEPSMSQRTGTGMPGPTDASTPPDAAMSMAPQAQEQGGQGGAAQAGSAGEIAPVGQAGEGGHSSRPARAGTPSTDPDADGGSAGETHADAGSCEPERCDDKDNDCDQKVDEEGACRCARSMPTGQGEACDRCVCDSCAEALDNCTGTDDDEWNMLCGDVLRCFGRSVQAGLCTGTDSDCYQNGDGPCAAEFRSAFARGFMCTSNPVRVPCGGLTRMRLECYQTKCAAVCKS